MTYKFVTREEYLEANQAGKESLFFKALAEREAYRNAFTDLCCPCLDQSCVQCKLDIDAMIKSRLMARSRRVVKRSWRGRLLKT